MNEHYPFTLKPLPYSYNALEPFIDTETMMLHHDKHLKTYVDNLNSAIAPFNQYYTYTLEQLISSADNMPDTLKTKVINNAGGVYNHNMFFDIMGKTQDNMPFGNIENAIIQTFGSVQEFFNQFKKAALEQFGSGYAWLVIESSDGLKIVKTPNQNTPDMAEYCPLLLIDVWEHAYYLKNQNRRNEYIDNWFNVIDWKKVESYFINCIKNRDRSNI